MRIITSIVLCLLLMVPAAGSSQTANGTITGTVSDASGAVIPGVSIEVKNTDTGVTFSTITTENRQLCGTQLAAGLPCDQVIRREERSVF